MAADAWDQHLEGWGGRFEASLGCVVRLYLQEKKMLEKTMKKGFKALWWKRKRVQPDYPVQNTEISCREPETELPDCLTIPSTHPQHCALCNRDTEPTETVFAFRHCVRTSAMSGEERREMDCVAWDFRNFRAWCFGPDLKPYVTAHRAWKSMS